MRAHVILFAKQPRLGRVKSRLARDIGALRALAFYRNNLSTIVRRLKGDARFRLSVAITPDRHKGRNPAWAQGIPMIGQGQGDLGERMARAIRNAPPGPVIIIGSDIPFIERTHLHRALKLLGRTDAVFGPSGDGGYWLIGMKRLKQPNHNLFRSVRWSGPHALNDSIVTLSKTDDVAFTDQLDDIDDGKAYRLWKAGES